MSSSYDNLESTNVENEEREGKEEEEEEKEFEEVNKVEEVEENEEEEEEIKVKKKRCQRRKISQVCYDEDGDEEEQLFFPDEEDEEDEEEEEDGSEMSYKSSILSAISFEWENQIYEFDELCDPGNIETIYKRYYIEPDLVDDTGALRYLYACDTLQITPTIRFLRALDTDEIDLSFRNIDSKNMRAMCYALEINIFVERLILKLNRLRLEDCSCLGRVLRYNEKISHLDLSGCKINPEGAKVLAEVLFRNDTLSYLNLSKCNLQDQGMMALSQSLMRNNSIYHLDLSYNNLGDGAAESLAITLKLNSSITHLNLYYNNLFDVQALKGFFRSLQTNQSVISLNLAWNGMNGKEIGTYIGNLLKQSSSLVSLDLSDNRFEGLAIAAIKKGLVRSKTLVKLRLGNNPMSPENLDSLLSGAKACSTLEVLDLENLWVKKSFMKILKKIKQEREFEVIFGGMFENYEVSGPDYAKVILQRAQFEAMKPKKASKRKDFGHLIWTLGDEPMTEEDFMLKVKKFKAKVSKELYPELINEFYNPKIKLIDVVAMKQKYLSIFPDSQPPPPPKDKRKGETEGAAEEDKGEKELVAPEGEEHGAALEIYEEGEYFEEEYEMREGDEKREVTDHAEHEKDEIFVDLPEEEDDLGEEAEEPNPENE